MRCASWAAGGCGSVRRADRSASSTRCSGECRSTEWPRRTARLRRRGIQVGHVHHARLRRRADEDLRATVEHLKRTAPDVFLTTVSYPIKGTPYYDAVADRLGAAARGPSAPIAIWSFAAGRSRRYYDFARRWMTGEVARHEHWQRGRYARAVRARAAVVGAGRRALGHDWRVAASRRGATVIVLFNPWSTPSPKKPLPMSLLALGSMLEGEFDYAIVDGNVDADPVGAIVAMRCTSARR